MKTKIITGLFLAMSCLGMQAQDKTQNYVRTRTYLSSDKKNYVDNIQYYDGIGRPLQTVSYGVKDTAQVGNTLATLQEYDDAGRETNSWLPTPINDSYADANTFKNLAKGNNGYSDANPYTTTVYEASPLNRVTAQYGAGQAWHSNGKAVKTEYLLNTAQGGSYPCKYYYLNNNTLSGGSTYYGAATLKVTKVTDEDGKVSYTFVDKIGRKLLERQVVGSENLDTYYVYDDLGNIRYVLQPKYQEEADLNKYAFQYKYENPFNKCSWKKLPGAAGISYEYDNEACLIFSQDGVQAASNRYTYYKYDAFYRMIEQGECTGQNNSNNAVVHLKNYYDDYSFVNALNDNVFKAEGEYCKGKLTGTEVTVLGSTSRLYTAFYYDGRGREIKRVQHNIFGGHEVTETTYTHTDKPSVVKHTYTASGKTTRTEEMTYSYDERDRLSTVTHKLGSNAAVTLASYTYDELGRMQSKKLHGSDANQLTYAYNIRNWLTNTTSSKFTQNLTYNNGTSGYFNGNISSMNWTANGASHSYSFTYDGANRMLNATHGNNQFTEKVTGYDKNGNILSLQRYGQIGAGSYGLVDNLTYILNGNQLSTVTDAVSTAAYGTNTAFSGTSSTYAYDANGNLTQDSGKGITNISYNCLNLPQEVTFSNGSSTTYTYAADGTKLAVKHKVGSASAVTTYYCGNVIYENGAQKLLLTEEGYVDLTNSTYHYYLKDHQGNNRVVINSSGTVKETNHYYPFGGLFAGTSVQPFKYNGKEFDSKNGLNWYDYGARHYDATLGRWHVVDPSAENYLPFSPYTYCANNPELFIDLNGRDWFYYKKEGSEEATWNWHDGNKYDTGVKDENGNNVILTGVESVVVFNGSYDEKLGADQTLDEKQGAKLAEVTVYGPKGENDIQQYKGYTMSSDPNLFGVVANGIYDVRRLRPDERKGPYESMWVLNNRGAVSALNNYNPAFPNRNPGYLDGVFIHRNNWNGFAGSKYNSKGELKAVSKGCLLITASQWVRFEKQLNGVKNLKLQINRE